MGEESRQAMTGYPDSDKPGPGEVPYPEKTPEILTSGDPDPKAWPQKDPEIIPGKDPERTPPPQEIPPPKDLFVKTVN